MRTTFLDAASVSLGGSPSRSPHKVRMADLQASWSDAVMEARGKCAHPRVLPGGYLARCKSTDAMYCPDCAARYQRDVRSVVASGNLDESCCIAVTIPVPEWGHTVEGAVRWATALPALRRNALERVKRTLPSVEYAWTQETSQSGAPHLHILMRLPRVATDADAELIRECISGTRTRQGRSTEDRRFTVIPALAPEAVTPLSGLGDADRWSRYITKDVGFRPTRVVTRARAAALVATAGRMGHDLKAARRFGYVGRMWGTSRGWSSSSMRSLREERRARFFDADSGV